MDVISFLAPSRGRPELLLETARGLLGLADHPEHVEIVVVADPDDEATHRAPVPHSRLVITPRRYGYAKMHRYMNTAAAFAAGTWLWLWNDDCQMLTPGWDTVVRGQEPGVLWPSADYAPDMDTFPVWPKAWTDHLGHMSLDQSTDMWISDLGEKLGVHRRIPVSVHHLRVTDQTDAERLAVANVGTFHTPEMRRARELDAANLRELLAWLPGPPGVVIVGGCGRAGLPFGIALASRGLPVRLYDLNAAAVATVNEGRMPFTEDGAAGPLAAAVADGTLTATTDPAVAGGAETLVVVVGTPVDEHHNPDLGAVPAALDGCASHLADGQLIILRSTVHPGVTALTERMLASRGVRADVAFCPERIAEGHAMTELFSLPQIVGARTGRAGDRAEKFFRTLTDQIIRLEPEEAELAKLFTNTWRYVKFATANQFWMMANDYGLDFEQIRAAIRQDYPRAADMPGAGFAAGPCLLKDTLQLAAFGQNNFILGHSAMLINEGLPLYIVSRLEASYDLPSLTVGVLGMGFKAGSDDPRESLSYKLRKILALKAGAVLCSDPYIADPRFVPLDEVLERADLLVIAAPHPEYRDLDTSLPVADIWGVTGHGTRI